MATLIPRCILHPITGSSRWCRSYSSITQMSIDTSSASAWAPLHYASCPEHHQLEVVRLLPEYGADVISKTDISATLLHLLSQSNRDPEVAEMLLKYGADPNIRYEPEAVCRDGILPMSIGTQPQRPRTGCPSIYLSCQVNVPILL
jgi:ankyrin repeat protein